MAACEQASLRWGEVGITEIVTSRAAPAVTVAPFSQPAEFISGADWIWWWVDATAAYGMLVQAKRVAVSGGRWHFDFAYPRGSDRQRRQLISTAETLGLFPAYALYLGTGNYRRWERCSDSHQAEGCLECTRRSLSVMPALLAREPLVIDSKTTYEWSIALENLWTPESARFVPIHPLTGIAPGLVDFLTMPQRGVRAISRAMIDRVLQARLGQFNAMPNAVSGILGGSHDRLGSVFSEFPDDHWGTPYFEQVLNPLRHTPPSYVLELVSSERVDTDAVTAAMPETIAGVVVVQLSPNS
ncbi:hypothetical protein C1S80_21190 [Mycolicibacterium aubagnense]|nr:hypothetical protein C1S80_21190 [Mycolicibacterium aubagnense]